MEYFATFLTGFGNVVTKALKKQIPDIKIKLLLDGLVVFQTDSAADLGNLPFLNNTFRLIGFLKDTQVTEIGQLINPLVENIESGVLPEHQTFTLTYSKENETTKMPGYIFDKFRQEIGKKIHGSYSPAGSLSLWIFQRSEGFVLVGSRLASRVKPVLEKGQLRPELAYLMCLLSEPEADDVFLDPFAGYGAIAVERAKFPHKKILAGDIDGSLTEKISQISYLTVGKWNALNLDKFADESISKIVTDPPWGLYHGKDLDLQKFYSQMLKEFYRVLKPGGLIVLLVGNKDLLEKLLRELKNFKLEAKFSTLVHGQKAGVFKLQKN